MPESLPFCPPHRNNKLARPFEAPHNDKKYGTAFPPINKDRKMLASSHSRLCRSLGSILGCFLIFLVMGVGPVRGQPPLLPDDPVASAESLAASQSAAESVAKNSGWTRLQVLAGSMTVFVLAVFIGFEVISKVPPTLHTPLMSGSNAISGITVVGAIIAAGQVGSVAGNFLGLLGICLAMANVVGGFYVTHRMLKMFKSKSPAA
jgi:NAD(P) transhydrogenase subunit alpha